MHNATLDLANRLSLKIATLTDHIAEIEAYKHNNGFRSIAYGGIKLLVDLLPDNLMDAYLDHAKEMLRTVESEFAAL